MFETYDIYDRERITLHCLITLQSPLSHIGEVQGNVSNLKLAKLLDLEGNPRSIFVYSGNAIRNGILRRRGTSAALESLGLQVNPDVHHTLFAGGRIDGGTANDMELDTRIRQTMPWLSVLGTAKPANVFGSKNAQMIHGRLAVGSAYLVCFESAEMIYRSFPGLLNPSVLPRLKRYLDAKDSLTASPFEIADPDAAQAFEVVKSEELPFLRKSLKTWTEFLTIDQTTRRDSTQDPSLRKFLTESQQVLLKGDSTKKEKEKSDQMIASDRLIMAGAKLYSRWDLHTTKIETGWIVDALLNFAQSPYIGGKSNRGNGLVHLDFWFQHGNNRGHFLSVKTGRQELSQLASDSHSAYQEYLGVYREFLSDTQNATAIGGLLNG